MQHLRIGHDAVKSPVTFREMRRNGVLRRQGIVLAPPLLYLSAAQFPRLYR